MSTFTTTATVCKVNTELGLVFGYAIVCNIHGEPYFDNDSSGVPDHIPEDAMLKSATDFMLNSRVGNDMHVHGPDGEPVPDGTVVFAFPMTADIAAALDIKVEKTGLLIAMKPSPDVLAKFKSGEYRGFSIGGKRICDEAVE